MILMVWTILMTSIAGLACKAFEKYSAEPDLKIALLGAVIQIFGMILWQQFNQEIEIAKSNVDSKDVKVGLRLINMSKLHMVAMLTFALGILVYLTYMDMQKVQSWYDQ